MKHLLGSLAVLVAFSLSNVAHANMIIFTGSLNSDDDVRFFTFVTPTEGAVSLASTMATTLFPTAATPEYPAGLYGFVPILSLYNSAGAYQADNYDPNFKGDATLNWFSSAGQLWYVALSQWGNQNGVSIPVNNPDPEAWRATFSQYGNTSYTGDNGCLYGQFCSGDPFDAQVQRGANWSVNFNGPDLEASQVVPEPGTLYHVIG